MSGFTPPYPDRPTRRLGLPEMIRRFRRNQVAVWYPGHFEAEFFATRLLARRLYVCNSPALVQEAFVQNPAALERKSPQMRHALEPLVGDGLIISDGLVWQERRRLVAGVTHVSRLAALTPVMTEAVAERRAAWGARTGETVDVLAEMAQLAAEVICRSVFGRALGGAAAAEVTEAFTRYQALVSQTHLPSLLNLPSWWPRWPSPRLRAQVRRIHAVIDRLIAAALAPGAEPSLIGALAASGKLTREGFRNEAATLFLAGHETTANTLAWCWYLLSQDPATAARLRAEARAVLGGRTAEHPDLGKLVFTRAVVEETLRLYPPIALLGREAQQDFTLGGHAIEKGALVLVAPWLLHRHRKLWEAPDEFRPDRFLPGAPPIPRHAFIPFSLGPRVCTGAAFAMAETVIALASLAQDFALAMPPRARLEMECRLTLRPGARLPMTLARAGV